MGCSQNEVLPFSDHREPLGPFTSANKTHLNDDDLVLVDGSIQLTICKEEALNRGVSASEYDLVSEQIDKLNKSREQFLHKEGNKIAQTKAGTRSINTIDMGLLIYQRDCLPFYESNKRYPIGIDEDSIIIHYSFSSPDEPFDTHELNYTFSSPLFMPGGQIIEYWEATGYTPVYNTVDSTMSLEYIFYGYSLAVCVYEIIEGDNY